MDHLRREVEQGREGREGLRGSWHRGWLNVPFAEDGEMARLSALFEHTRNEVMGNFCMEVASRLVGLGYASERGSLKITSMLMSEDIQWAHRTAPVEWVLGEAGGDS